jgi:hypothetical protein
MTVTRSFLNNFEEVMKRCSLQKTKGKTGRQNFDVMQKDGRLPEGGLEALRARVEAFAPIAQQIIDKATKDKKVSPQEYNRSPPITYMYAWILMSYCSFLSYLMAHIYVANPQARVGAFHLLTTDTVFTLLNNDGMASSSNFKTQKTYGSQVILACKATQDLLVIYRDRFRTIFENEESGNTLFINTLGREQLELGRFLTLFFKPDLHITTTSIR